MEQNCEELYGLCSRCKQPKSYYDWCPSCDNQKLVENFSNWTSGDKKIDEFIQDTQRNARSYSTYLEWIPWEQFKKIELYKDAFDTRYIAKWINGERNINFWMDDTADISRERSDPVDPVSVAIRFFSKFYINEGFNLLDGCKNHYECLKNGNRFYRFYGFTLNPETNEYGAVFQYVSDGNLRDYLRKNKKLTWQEKVNIVYYIIQDLAIIHKAGLYHRSIHSLSILMNGDWAYLSELDLSTKIDLEGNQHKLGIMPFIAPEVLSDKPYTQSADIYSIGIVMFEIASGDVPFRGRHGNWLLEQDICDGLRPEIKDSIPEAYSKIMQACWDSDPLKRPDIFKLQAIFTRWRQNPPFNITQQFEQADHKPSIYNTVGSFENLNFHIFNTTSSPNTTPEDGFLENLNSDEVVKYYEEFVIPDDI